MNGTATIADAGPYSYTSSHNRNTNRIRPLFHRPAGSGRSAPGPPGTRRRRGSHLHRSRTHRHEPRPTLPRPGPRRRARRRHLGRAELDRLARYVPDARTIADRLRERGVKLALGQALYDPDDPMGKMFFNIFAVRSRSHPHAHLRGDGHRPSQRTIEQQAAQTVRPTAAGTLPHACHWRVVHQRSRRTLLRLKTNRLSHTQPAPFSLAYDPAPYQNRPV